MNKKRTLAMLLAGAMLLPANAFAASPEDFTDFPTDWSAAGLRSAVQNGLLNGSNGQINSSGLLIRAQMAAIVNRAFAARKTADLSVYSDANTSAWYYNDLELAVAMRTFQGANGKLNPEAPITREEAFVVLARAFALESGDTSVLNNYTDGASVSAWARSSVAALIENGYVNGANGKLNPKTSITRAEFAKVISEMASTYADADDSLSATVDGSVIVRENSVSLSGKTINGDLIIADGVSRIDLTGVTVTGRIVLRGGESGVTFKDTKAEKGVIANTDIAVSGSVDNITVAQGSAITVNSGASVGSINVNAEGAKITGAGKVGTVKANANNVTVTTTGTKVTAADSVSGVKAGDKAVSAGKTETVGSTASGGTGGSTGGGSSSGGSSSGGSSSGGASSDGSTAQQNLVVAEQTKLVDMNTVNLGALGQFVVVHFEKGNNLDNCTLTVDGAEINSACTDVSTDGSIVKWQSTVLNPSTLTVTNKSTGKTQTIHLGGTNTATPTVAGKPQDYNLLAHGPVYVWDYHQTNKDSAGNVRVSPSHTTIDTAETSNAIRFYSPDAVLTKSENSGNLYGVTGTVELMFNYANGTQAERDWVDGISSVVLLQDDESNSELNTNLTWKLDKAYPHGKAVDGVQPTVACIKVPIGQINFYSNGRYKLRVVSNGKAELFPIHVVNEKTPSMALSDMSAKSGVNTHFEVSDMLYGITQPIYRVELTDPNDNTSELTKIDDWYLIGDTFVLYNDNTDHLSVSGNYTLTIYANGFKKFSKTFYASGADNQQVVTPAARAAAAGVDALSAATSGGGGATSSSGAEGGSNTMNADLVFSADLLTNAKIVEELKLDNTYANAISERWDNMISDSIYYEGAEKVYTRTGFFDAANQARTQNQLLTFAEYTAREDAKTTPNRPYAVKKVLEDNLLGEATSFSEASSWAAPYLVPVIENEDATFDRVTSISEGQDVTLLASGSDVAAYLNKLQDNDKAQVYLNQGTSTLSPLVKGTDYTIDTDKGTITIKADKLKLSDNDLKIVVENYQPVKLTLTVIKEQENVSLSAPESVELGNDVTITCSSADHVNGVCDFFKYLNKNTAVRMTGPDGTTRNVLPDGQEGSNLGWKVNGNTLTIGANLFKEKAFNNAVGTYTLTLAPDYYTEKTVSFEVKAKDNSGNTDVEVKDAPNFTSVTAEYSSFASNYTLNFAAANTADVENWMKALKDGTVTVNGESYTYLSGDNKFSYNANDLKVFLNESKFKKNDSNVIVLTAAGYNPVTITLDADNNATVNGSDNNGGNTSNGDSSDTESTLPTTVSIAKVTDNNTYYTLTFNNAEWVGKVSSISIKNKDTIYTPADKISDIGMSNKYYLDKENGMIALYINTFSTPCDMIISANGYDDLTVHVEADYWGSSATIVK